MLERAHLILWPYDGPVPEETRQLECDGHCVLRSAFSPDEVRALRAEVLDVYARYPADLRAGIPTPAEAEVFRYEMLSRSALCQRANGNPRVLAVLEPLLGGDCHVVSSTAWRNPPGEVKDPSQYYWHIDGGPHVPRRAGVPWPDAIPYPIFVVATHVYLDDCELDDGPTTVMPGSHRSGSPPPLARRYEPALEYEGRGPVSHVVRAGDVGFFVSDSWHRRALPTARSRGRFFLQTNYGRRDIAQRLRPPDAAIQVSAECAERAGTTRERMLIGLHPPGFYDG